MNRSLAAREDCEQNSILYMTAIPVRSARMPDAETGAIGPAEN